MDGYYRIWNLGHGGSPNLFPILTFGKYDWEGEQLKLSMTLTISHAAADGYHAQHVVSKSSGNTELILIECAIERSKIYEDL
jgi:chloramphenicol O-acetyltransferase type A